MNTYTTKTGMPFAFRRHLIGEDIAKLTRPTSMAEQNKVINQILADTLQYLGEDGYQPSVRDIEMLLRTDARYMLYVLVRDFEYGDVKEYDIKEQEIPGLTCDLKITIPGLEEEVAHTNGTTGTFPVTAVPTDDEGKPIHVTTFAEWRAYASNRVCGDYSLTPILAGTSMTVGAKPSLLDLIRPCKVMRRLKTENGDYAYITADLAKLSARDISKLYYFVLSISGKTDTTIQLTEEDGVPAPTTIDVMHLSSFYMPSFPV